MIEHTATLEEVKQLSDGQIAFRSRCCGDPRSDSWHTHNVSDETTEEKLEAEIQAHCERVAGQHERLLFAIQYAEKKRAEAAAALSATSSEEASDSQALG